MRGTRAEPLTTGDWVRGEHFHGRSPQIAEILDGPRDCLWLLGTRLIGKTSLLKHVELLAQRSPERGFVPVFWDLRGANSLAELSTTFHRSLSEAQLDQFDSRSTDAGAEDLFASIGRVRRHLNARSLKLLLLGDDAAGLVRIRDKEPTLLRKLRRALQPGDGMRTVLASTLQLWALAEETGDVSPFLHAFIPPLYLRSLSDEEAHPLIAQIARLSEARRAIDDATAERLRESTGGHPYLLRMLCKRTLELGSVEEAAEQITADETLSALILSDLDTLPEADQAMLEALAEQATADAGELQAQLALDASTLKASLFRLESLGLVRRHEQDRFAAGNDFLRRWVAATRPRWPDRQAAARATAIVAGLSREDRPTPSTPDDLFGAVYDPLRNLARRYLWRERSEHTLQPTALVHEAYLKLVDQSRVNWKGRTHFFAVGAQMMRRILVDHARSHGRAKRGGEWFRVTLSGLQGSPIGPDLDPAQLLAVHTALEKLARLDERQARVVELRFFAGLTMTEVAEVLGVSKRTADGDWAKARAWLEQELAGTGGKLP